MNKILPIHTLIINQPPEVPMDDLDTVPADLDWPKLNNDQNAPDDEQCPWKDSGFI